MRLEHEFKERLRPMVLFSLGKRSLSSDLTAADCYLGRTTKKDGARLLQRLISIRLEAICYKRNSGWTEGKNYFLSE